MLQSYSRIRLPLSAINHMQIKSLIRNRTITNRSSHQRCSVRKGVLRNSTKGKHLCQSLLQATCNFIKNETLAQVFSCEFCEISKNTFFTEHLLTTALSLSVSRPMKNTYLTLSLSSSLPFYFQYFD